MRLKSLACLATAAVWVGLVSGCASSGKTNLAELTRQFEAQSQPRLPPSQPRLPCGVTKFEIKGGLVTASLEGADLDESAHLLVDRSGLSCVLPKVRLKGSVTQTLRALAPADALRAILKPFGYPVEDRDGVLVVSPLAHAPGELCTEEAVLSHATSQEVVGLLRTIDGAEGKLGASFTAAPSSNGILLNGPCAAVDNVLTLIASADKRPVVVAIEALVVKYSDDASSFFGSSFWGIQKGKYSSGSVVGGSGSISFNYDVLDNLPSSFFSNLNLLVTDGRASIVSRPYIAVKSGQEAKIDLLQQRYFMTYSYQGGVPTSQLESVPAGVVLRIRPIITDGRNIDLNVDVEQSVFTGAYSSSQSLAATVERTEAKTNVGVEDGQTLIIGGLVRETKSDQDSGFPGVRKVPFFNFFGSQKYKASHKEELVLYITPRIIG